MSENKLVSTPTPKALRPKSGEQLDTQRTYRAPRLVVLGSAVELVQGYTGHIWDVRGNSHM
jgi:hypothetical protein